jgi:ubiquinone/menaquinone biosynthesis C-methylase UbiE
VIRDPAPHRTEARQRYDRLAAGYDCQLGLRSGRIARTLEALRKRAVAALRLEPGQTVIDVGCGTGDSFARLVTAVGARGHVIGVDQSAGMLAVAARRVAEAGHPNVALIEAPVEEAELPKADAALCFFTHDLLRTPAALDRVAAAVRPGGRIAAAGMRRPPRRLARIALPARLVMRRYVTTLDGLDRPWDLLAERLGRVASEFRLFGALYVVSGVVPGVGEHAAGGQRSPVADA